MRRLYLMRHGETLYLGRASVDGDDLTPAGRRQIEAAAVALDGVALDLIVASPMRRAQGTAGIVASRRGLTVETAPELREITPGTVEGLAVAEVFGRIVEFFSSPLVDWDTPFLDGETFRQLHERVMRFLTTLLDRPHWSTALAVAHGGVNMALLAGVLGMGEGEIPRLEQDLGCVNAIDFRSDGRPLVRLMNFSPLDPVKATLREPGFAHLERAAAARLAHRGSPDDPLDG